MNKNKYSTVFIFLLILLNNIFHIDSKITLNEKCNGLSGSFLKDAYLVNMDKDVILKTEGLIYKTEDLENEILKNNEKIKDQLAKYKLFLLEQIIAGKIVVIIGKKELEKSKMNTENMTDDEIIKKYISLLTSDVYVSDNELKKFYDENQSMMGGASFESVKPQLKEYVINQKKQEKINQVIGSLGKYQKIEVNQEWILNQCKIEKNNIVDNTRFNGKPSMIDFGSKGCVPCDMMTPILEKLKNKYKNKINVLFIHVNEEQILGAKFNIQSIPVQVFFDKKGNEVFRHEGFFAEEEIEKKFIELKFK